ncbi:FadR/GntR family transcriptional regulator [Petroclostridium sp. X23]|uniref:FadR/GntR family transcriptional regulator n=1 Tax=Petroclostridium sp. X23 TaxID=3045146 RepID=UPI0024AD1EE0|nr:FadR/GntR family transcriptional regulator [Petroclostridium sp. X23]WHH59371.1 FadR/GntR family transcriptional regulator [Petroclostridium sp. X23]
MKPIKKSNISQQVFERIRDQIIKGVWKPGEKIPSENELSSILDVSRISIRAALQKLITLGLLEARQGEGTYVKELDPAIYMNSLIPIMALNGKQSILMMEFRQAIEIETAGLAADKATDEDIEKLEKIYKKMELYKDDGEPFCNEDLNFHVALAEMTGNPFIIQVFYIIKDIFGATIVDIYCHRGEFHGLYYHKKILEAIKKKDRNLTREIMEEHILDSIESLMNSEKNSKVN